MLCVIRGNRQQWQVLCVFCSLCAAAQSEAGVYVCLCACVFSRGAGVHLGLGLQLLHIMYVRRRHATREEPEQLEQEERKEGGRDGERSRRGQALEEVGTKGAGG